MIKVPLFLSLETQDGNCTAHKPKAKDKVSGRFSVFYLYLPFSRSWLIAIPREVDQRAESASLRAISGAFPPRRACYIIPSGIQLHL